MPTDIATITIVRARPERPRAVPTIAVGLFGGAALGVVARSWMRLISEEPEFTWSGTIFIVAGFTVFGLTQSVVALARNRTDRRWKLTIIRVFGVVATLPLFVAAGAVMFPTVAGCGLASARREWHPLLRGTLLLIAAAPVLFVGNQLVDAFGWSLHSLAGFTLMLAIYAVIVWATRFALCPQADGWRMTRRTKLTLALVIALLMSLPFVASVGLS